MDPRSHADVLAALAAVNEADRAEREAYGASLGGNEQLRRQGLRLAARWLTDTTQTIGPLQDGPASSARRVQDELDVALRLLPERVSPYPRFCRSAGRGMGQRYEAEVLGVAQMLAWALGQLDAIPDLDLPATTRPAEGRAA